MNVENTFHILKRPKLWGAEYQIVLPKTSVFIRSVSNKLGRFCF